MREILVKLGVEFKQEKYLNKSKFRADFLIGDLFVIEVQGDYYHSNPSIYDHRVLTLLQKNNKKRDLKKHEWYKSNGFKLLLVWESDLQLNRDLVINNIKNFIYGNK